MGGWGSGRYGHRLTVEESLRIPMSFLKDKGYFKGGGAKGTMAWHSKEKQTGAAAIETAINTENGGGELIIRFALNYERILQRIALCAVPMRFGGYRFYALCPRTYQRCTVLLFSARHKQFISVKASGLLYGSQTEELIDRVRRKKDKAEKAYLGQSPYTREPTKHRLWRNFLDLDEKWENLFQAKLGWFSQKASKLRERIERES